MILTIGNTKGGVGKSTLSINISIARAIASRDVLLIDADRQMTTQTAIGIRADAGYTPGIACIAYSDGLILRTQIKQQESKYDDIIIDAGGRDSSALRAALILSDVLLVPFQPRSFDVWALADIATLIDEAMSIRDGLKAFAILNCADSGDMSQDNTDAGLAVSEFPRLKYIQKPIRRRKAYANASAQGLSVLELKPNDKKAKDELIALVETLFSY